MLVYSQDDAGRYRPLKACCLDRHAVDSRVQSRHSVVTGGAGLGVRDNTRGDVSDVNLGIGHHGAGIIGDGAKNGSRCAALAVQQAC